MNIAVKIYGGGVCSRPDTTWERENKDFYSPDFIDSYLYTPVLFVKICKAGRSVSSRFASRYYDSAGFGILLYPGNILKENNLACASCIDHTSILPPAVGDKSILESSDAEFSIFKNGVKIHSVSGCPIQLIDNSIEEITRYMSVRIGDIVAIELDAPAMLIAPDDGENVELKGEFCGNEIFLFNVIR